ncbi:hypothetical protein Hoch_0721 [Haliangium ochraceum DSM 14365]|uniref:Uncharacterized protein n=2 Tax=Haliangium ochraceum TaxID=80816 RepID=D0LMX8_HALO1|nr:hypothetical protein Hoch_0721 [Haliangium ochraceum DSM 14365]
MEMFVRLKPFAPERGHVLRRYSCRGIRFREAGGWQRVPHEVAAYLRGVRQQPGDPRSPLAFDVCAQFGADAEPVVVGDRSGLPAPHAAASEAGRDPLHRELASETTDAQPHREPAAALTAEPEAGLLAASHASAAPPDDETLRPQPERKSTTRTKSCASLPESAEVVDGCADGICAKTGVGHLDSDEHETAGEQHLPAGAICAQTRWTEQTSPPTDGASARSSARLLGPYRAAAPAGHRVVAPDLGASGAPRRPPVARRLRRHVNRGPPVGTTKFEPRSAERTFAEAGRRSSYLDTARHQALVFTLGSTDESASGAWATLAAATDTVRTLQIAFDDSTI